MRFVVWIEEMLYFGHCKLSDTQQSRSRRNFIAKGIANLCSGERQSPMIVIQQPFEIHENALRSLWSQISIDY